MITRIFAVVALALATSACAMGMAEQQATMDNLRAIQAANTKVSVGDFTRGPAVSESDDRSIMIRAGKVIPPNGGTFTAFLRQTLITELTAGGKLDANSPIVITGRLTRSDVDAGISKGTAALGATFVVTRGGMQVFEKAFEVKDEWPGDFLGAVAIPAAMDHYTALYAKLVGALLADPEFRAVVRGS